MTRSIAISAEGVGFRYGDHWAIQDATLHVHEHEFACVVGPNGGGKTTLLRLLMGQLQPENGQLRVFGLSPVQARSLIGYMPQRSGIDPRFPILVQEVVLMGRLGKTPPFGRYRREDREAADEALKSVRLLELRRRPFSDLSGGQQQRVLLARALASEPRLLLLDEPMANLDPRVEGELMDLLLELNRHLTIVMVSHDLGFVSPMVEKVICVNRQVMVHPTAQITGDIIRELYGGEVRAIRHARMSPEGECCDH